MMSAPGATTSGLISRSPWVGPQLLNPAIRLVSLGLLDVDAECAQRGGLTVVVVDDRAVREADHVARDGRLGLEPVVGHDERRLVGCGRP